MSLPDVDLRIIELRARGETVTIGGEHKAKRSEKDVDFHYKEIS